MDADAASLSLRIGSVDCLQGAEEDIAVLAYPPEAEDMSNFLLDVGRTSVAFSRSARTTYVVGLETASFREHSGLHHPQQEVYNLLWTLCSQIDATRPRHSCKTLRPLLGGVSTVPKTTFWDQWKRWPMHGHANPPTFSETHVHNCKVQ